jgi:hypothetical protein
MQAEGQLLKNPSGGYTIELRKDRPHGRRNFTCAHEVAHTFFFEKVPLIKYQRIESREVTYDSEEEFLCNVAASELLMPLESLKRIASAYTPSPESLQQLAGIYETSLTAMAIRLTRANLWRARFILWQRSEEDTVRARWVVGPDVGLCHFPKLDIENYERSSINHAFSTDEVVEGGEWLGDSERFRYGKMRSIRVTPDYVLSCVGSFKDKHSFNSTIAVSLPIDYACTCNGTGTRLIRKNGLTYASRCLANHH